MNFHRFSIGKGNRSLRNRNWIKANNIQAVQHLQKFSEYITVSSFKFDLPNENIESDI